MSDAPVYHGRASEAERLAKVIIDLREREGHGLIALVGPSGCGKSSLLAAGLVGQQCTYGLLSDWSVSLCTTDGLTDFEANDLVVIDQFEDIWQESHDSKSVLLQQVEQLSARVVVVFGLRSDAFPVASQEPSLVPALSRPVMLAPLTRDELREVIVTPAEMSGVLVDDDLLHVLQSDLAPGSEVVAPDVLPLLSNALLVTWAVGGGGRMTVADYRTAGGVAGAIESLAEQVHKSLSVEQRSAARSLFLRMVTLSGEGVIRRTVSLSTVEQETRPICDAFIAARMFTVADDRVGISHDALLLHWSRLREWIGEGRADLAMLARLRRAADVWLDNERDPSGLIAEHRLAPITTWLEGSSKLDLLTAVEKEFLDASRVHYATALDAERQISARLQRERRLALTLAALTMAFALLATLAWLRGEQYQARAVDARNEAQSRQVATMATALRAKDPQLYSQMSVVAGDLANTQEARTAMVSATGVDTPIRWSGHPEGVLAASSDGQLVVRGDSAGEVTLWRGEELISSPGKRWTVDGDACPLEAVAVARERGRDLLAIAGGCGAALWDITAEPKQLANLGVAGLPTATAFSSDVSLLGIGDTSGRAQVWSIADLAAPEPLVKTQLDEVVVDGATSRPEVSSISIDSRRILYVGGSAGTLSRWRLGIGPPKRLRDLDTTVVADDGSRTPARVQALAISADGKRLAAGVAGRRVFRWQINGTRAIAEIALRSFDSWVNGLAFSADSTRLVVASSDQDVSIYDARSGREVRRLTNPAVMTSAVLVGDRPVAVGVDGILRVWSAEGPLWRTEGSAVYNLSSDGAEWLAGGTPEDGIALWRLGTPLRNISVAKPNLPDGDTQVGAVAVAPSGRYLLGGTAQGRVLSWPLTPDGPGMVQIIDAGIRYVAFVAVSPDSSLVAAMEYQGTHTVLFRAGSDGHLEELATISTPSPQLFGFSGDSSVLAVALGGRRVALWSVVDPQHPTELGGFGLETVPTTLNMAPQTQRIAVGEESGSVSIWDFSDPGEPKLTLTFADAHSAMYSLAFSPDERSLLGTSGDDLIWGWDLTEPSVHAAFAVDGDLGRPWDVRFIDSGRRFAVSGDSGRVRVLTAGSDDARRQLCEGRGDPLSDDEWARYLPGVQPRDPC